MRDSEVAARVARLREALSDGDMDFLSRGLADLERDVRPAARRGIACPVCPRSRFRWPGELDAHVRLHHPELWEARCAA